MVRSIFIVLLIATGVILVVPALAGFTWARFLATLAVLLAGYYVFARLIPELLSRRVRFPRQRKT